MFRAILAVPVVRSTYAFTITATIVNGKIKIHNKIYAPYHLNTDSMR